MELNVATSAPTVKVSEREIPKLAASHIALNLGDVNWLPTCRE